ncbi:MAG TPA: PocR ligand-binding domain-containing protein [Herpetosiphonaceae bacterium]
MRCSVVQPTGDGVRDPQLLLRGPAPGDLSRWYDTYDGTRDLTPDWYELDFGQSAQFNTIFFTHGPMFPDGGWWTSLSAEYDAGGGWRPIPGALISPDYDLSDRRGERRPFESFVFTFPPIAASKVRLIGVPGGGLRITTMSYLAAGLTSPDMAEAYRASLQMPSPRIFQLLAPNALWDFIAALQAVTGIHFDVQSAEGLGLDHFLSGERHCQFHERHDQLNHANSLYNLLGIGEGWQQFGMEMHVARALALQTQQLQIRQHHGGMAWVVLPVSFNGEVLGTIENRNLISLGAPDAAWHDDAQRRLAAPPERYAAALAEVPVFDAAKLADIMRLVGLVIDLVRLGLPLQVAQSQHLLR